MATVDVLDWSKKKVGTVELNEKIFDQPLRKDLLHTIVRWQLAKRQQGTHQVKTRSIIAGSSKKPFKQKGTGNARQGNRRSPLLEGGAVVHGPSPRSYAFDVPKKVRRTGLKVALSHLLREGKLHVVDSMESAEGKTKELASQLKSFGIEKSVLISADKNDMVFRAAKNLAKYRYYGVDGLNVYDLLKFDNAIVTKDAIEKIQTRLGEGAGQ